MAAVVVVGGGFGGLAAAVRLAKLGHRVVLCEQARSLGGAVHEVRADRFVWDAGPASVTLPAVLRDLFRKSGRPIEREVELVPLEPGRRHMFPDGSVVDLPMGSRGAQRAAIDDGLGHGGQAWCDVVDAMVGTWDCVRRTAFDVPWELARPDRTTRRTLRPRQSLTVMARRAFRDPRLREMLALPVRLAGSEPARTPAFCAVWAYVERTFGLWTVVGGMHRLRDALVDRLHERGVEVRTGTPVLRVEVEGGVVTAVHTADGDRIPADVVVCGVDARRLVTDLLGRTAATTPMSETARRVEMAAPAMPPRVLHLGLRGDLPVVPAEVVVHGDPLMVVRTRGTAPAGHAAWTVLLRGGPAREDVLAALARRGLDIRDKVVTRIDRSPADIVGETAGSPYGLAWDGVRTVCDRLPVRTAVPGLFCVGASARPGAGVPLVGVGAAQVADAVGRA